MTTPEPFSADEARSVTEVWRGLGLPELIDVHTHFMPRNVMDKVWAYFDSAGPMLGPRLADQLSRRRRSSGRRAEGFRGASLHVDDLSTQTRHGRVAQR